MKRKPVKIGIIIVFVAITVQLLANGAYAKRWSSWDFTAIGYSRICPNGIRFSVADQFPHQYRIEFYQKPSVTFSEPFAVRNINGIAPLPNTYGVCNPKPEDKKYCQGPFIVPWNLSVGTEIDIKAFHIEDGTPRLLGRIAQIDNLFLYVDTPRPYPNNGRVSACNVFDSAQIVTGLGTGSNGWSEAYGTGVAYLTNAWSQSAWGQYNGRDGETRLALGDIDNDGENEVVVGFDQGTNGWFEIRGAEDFNQPIFGRVNWSAYNNRNGETRPAIGNVDGGTEGEILLGLGRTGNGFVEIRDGAGGQYNSIRDPDGIVRWIQVPFANYNDINGETRPATGDLDGELDPQVGYTDEIVVGLGTGGGGRVAIFNNFYSFFVPDSAGKSESFRFITWKQLPWSNYNIRVVPK